ncbi:unnamed protein product [Schistosoma margrebowiei]|uniref:Uncharacterized protein n=1 Tax=Schistosoma margrebowiei TaxID=48269 RepID=A0AA84ZJN2_9TREM|nr:unnamed protein product [Schistosoma margrebowiei]
MPNNRRRKLSPRLVDVKRDEQKDGSPQSKTAILPNYFVLVSIGRGRVSNSSRQLSSSPNVVWILQTVSHQSIYQNSHAIVPGMVFPNDSHISDEIPCKSEENMLSEHIYDQKPDVVLIDANFSDGALLCNDILNEFHENILEESNPYVISYVTCPYNAYDPCEKPVHCEARVLSELNFDYNSDDFIPTAVHPYHKSTYNVYSSQYVLNEVTLFITWGYKDPTLFRGGG